MEDQPRAPVSSSPPLALMIAAAIMVVGVVFMVGGVIVSLVHLAINS